MAEHRGKVFVGTSGFAFKEWKGNFYPEGVTDKKMLSYYSSVLPSVEINYTFRRVPTESTIENWKSQAAEGFKLSLKAPQRITHIKRLNDVQDDVDEFVRRVRALEDRLGAILFQLPPSFRYDRERIEKFLVGLPPVCAFAMEFRHDSWADPEVKELLAKSNVALCGADTDEKAMDEVPATAGHAYLRLRKEEYSAEDIVMWGKRVGDFLDRGSDVYCYFKHDEGTVGPEYAAALVRAVG
jgi:uncharacterized protein YecE (DUF72 family)